MEIHGAEGCVQTKNLKTMPMTNLFQQYRSYLFAVAYRMLGSVQEAEDMVQDAFLRLRAKDAEEIGNPRACFATVVTRLCLGRLAQLRRERELYDGPWLPEPLPTGDGAPPGGRESLSTAYLLMLENLNPVERAAFLLREAFGHSYEDIGLILDKTPENCRQLLSRARRRLKGKARPRQADNQKTQNLLQQLVDYAEKGQYAELANLFVQDARLIADGGGKARGAAKHVLHGVEKAARFILGATRKLRPEGASFEFRELNGAPALVGYHRGSPYLILAISHDGERIREVYAMANPEKLGSLKKK